MAESDGAWGALAQHDDELAEVWDGFERLPDPGENELLDSFVERKRITIPDLVRLGARLAEPGVLAFAFSAGIKFRNLVTDKRHSYVGSTWTALKLVPGDGSAVIVCEGETDGARLSSYYDCDVAVLPAGAGYFPDAYAEQLVAYETIYVALDDDHAGNAGAARIMAALPQAQRFLPPANDWCEAEELPALPTPTGPPDALLVPAGELLTLEPPDIISWFEHALLPVGGQLILHGWAKSFKSFLALDMLAALSQGEDWCCFEPTEEPCRVAVMQYEIPWPYYQARIRQLRVNARHPGLFDSNLLSWRPLTRPQFRAGIVTQEDEVLRELESAGVQVFCLDPVRRATGGADLNSEAEVRPLLGFYERVQSLGIAVVTCHHDNKSAARMGGGDPTGMTGAGAFAGDADTIVSVSVPRGKSVEDPYRNLHFTLRNAPGIAPRGMQMGEDGTIVYSPVPHGDGYDADDGSPPI